MASRCFPPAPPAALPSLLLALLLLGAATLALPFPSASPEDARGDADAEVDSDATQRVLGSSVVTSVSVIMDLGNGTRVLAAPAPAPRPGERIPAVASPASLMHPDRYEFYTFDEAGDLVKRYMTLPQIQSMIAGGDGSPAAALASAFPLQPLGEGRVPAADPDSADTAPSADAPSAPPGVVVADQDVPTPLGVREVVDRVQNVLRSELEANKNKVPTPGTSAPTAPLAEEPGDSSGAWSVLLPAMMGSAVETASPSTPAAPTSPTPVATNATTARPTTLPPTTQAPHAHDEASSAPTTLKATPTEAPTEASPTDRPAAASPSTLKHSPTRGSTPELITEMSISASFSSSQDGSPGTDGSSQDSEDDTSSSSSESSESNSESQESSTDASSTPPETQNPAAHDDAALSKPPQTPPPPTAESPAILETSTKIRPPKPSPTPFAVSSETPMLLTAEEPSSETPMLIPVYEPSPPTPSKDDTQDLLPASLPQRPLRPIIVPEERVPTTTPETETPHRPADDAQEKPAEVSRPVPSVGLLPPAETSPESESTPAVTTVQPQSSIQVSTVSPPQDAEKIDDQEAQSQKIPSLFLGLLPPFPDPLEDGPSMPDEIPVLLDPAPFSLPESTTVSDPPITTYRPPYTTQAALTPEKAVVQETTQPTSLTETVSPTETQGIIATTPKVNTGGDNNALKAPSSDAEEKQKETTTTPRAETSQPDTSVQQNKITNDENPGDKDDTETAESDSSLLKGVSGVAQTTTPAEFSSLKPTSSTEDAKATEMETTVKPPPASPTTVAKPNISPSSTTSRTVPLTEEPEDEQPAELDISQELADSLSSVLSQVAEQPTTIIIDHSPSEAVLKADKTEEETEKENSTPNGESESTSLPQVTDQPKEELQKPSTSNSPETSTTKGPVIKVDTAVRATTPSGEDVRETTISIAEETTVNDNATTPGAKPLKNTTPKQEDQTTGPSAGEPSLVTLSTTDSIVFRTGSTATTTTTEQIPDDRENKVTPRPVTVALVELSPVSNPSSTQPEIVVRIPSRTTTTTTSTTTTTEAAPPATDKTMHLVGSGEDEELTNNKAEEIEKDIEKETENEKENDALVKRQEEIDAKLGEQAEMAATTEAEIPQTTSAAQKTQETFVATTTPQPSTPFKIVVEDSPVVYEDEETFNSYTALPSLSPSPAPFTTTRSPSTTSAVPSTTNAPTTAPADRPTVTPLVKETFATTTIAREDPIVITSPSKNLLPPESLYVGSDKEGTDMVNNSQDDEDVHAHKEPKPLLKIVPEEENEPLSATTIQPKTEQATTPTAAAEATETVPPTTQQPQLAQQTTKDEDETETPTDAYNTRYEESAISDAEPTTETAVPETTAAPVVATTEKEEATTLKEEPTVTEQAETTVIEQQETTVTKDEDATSFKPETTIAKQEETTDSIRQETTVAKQEETTVGQEEETFLPTNAPTTLGDDQPPKETTDPTAETTLSSEDASETTTGETIRGEDAAQTTEAETQTEMAATTERQKEEATTQAATAETEAPAAETQTPADEDDSVAMEPVTGPTTIQTPVSNKPVVEEKLETSSSSPVLTKIGQGEPAQPAGSNDPLVVLITKPPHSTLGLKDSAHDVRPAVRPRPPPAVQFQPAASTAAPQLHHHPSVQVQPSPPRPSPFLPAPTPGFEPVSLDPAPGENLGLEVTTVSLGSDVRKFADLCNELAFRLWGAVTVRGLHSGRSVVMSPMGVTSVLAMVFLGARGPTSGQMNDILKLDDMVTFNPHQVFRNVTESVVIGRHPGIATAAFVRELYSDRSKGRLLDFYKERAQQFYDGHVEEVNFNVISDIVRRRTNMLVKRQTRGRVPEYLRGSHIQLHPPLAAFGANIFQTDCSDASTEGRDGEMYFTVLPGSRQRRLVLVPAAVWRSGFLAGYDPHLDCTAVALGGPEALASVVLLLPGQQGQLAAGDGVAALERRLTEPSFRRGAWARVLRSLLPRPGLELQLPRFSHRSLLNVTAALQRMGLRDLFSAERADLRGLNGVANDLHLSDIVQVNTFSTCAEGAATGGRHHAEVYPGGAGAGSGRSGRGDLAGVPLALRPRQGRDPESSAAPAPRLRFDRPFLYAVRHNPTGFLLHMGRFNPHLLH